MQQWKKRVSAGVLLVMATAAPAWADDVDLAPSNPDVVSEAADLSVEGTLTFVELEGGYYAVDGWMLKGDKARFQQFLDQRVTVVGTRFDGPSIQMVKALEVKEIRPSVPMQEVQAGRTLPKAITVNGKEVAFDQSPEVTKGTLMVPIRHVVTATGGSIQWDGGTQTVTITVGDRTARFVIDSDSAEINRQGVQTMATNQVKMERPATLINGRTFISADALTSVLGYLERGDRDTKLDLVLNSGITKPEAKTVNAQAVAIDAVPDELRTWIDGIRGTENPASKSVVTESGVYVAIAGGMRYSGGHRVEIVGEVRQQNGVWVADAQVIAPTGPAIMILTNPVATFFLPGVTGDVEVRFISEPLPTAK